MSEQVRRFWRDARRHGDLLLVVVLIVVVTIFLVVDWHVVQRNEDVRRAQTIIECQQLFEYSDKQCAFIVRLLKQ